MSDFVYRHKFLIAYVVAATTFLGLVFSHAGAL